MQTATIKSVTVIENVWKEDETIWLKLQGKDEHVSAELDEDTYNGYRERIEKGEKITLELTKSVTPEEKKKLVIAERQKKRTYGYTPRAGYVAHPLRRLPRNFEPCPCGKTGKKFKKCCLPKLAMYIPGKDAKIYEDYVKEKMKHG